MLLWNLLLLLPSLSEVSLRSSPPSLPPSLPLSIRPTMALRHERGREERKQPPLPRNSGCSLFLRGGGEDREERGRLLLLLPPLSWEGREANSPPQLSFLPHCASSGRERERGEKSEGGGGGSPPSPRPLLFGRYLFVIPFFLSVSLLPPLLPGGGGEKKEERRRR